MISGSAFAVSGDVFIVVLLATAVTYVWRAGGYWLMGFVKPTPRIERALAALPGSIVAAIVLPTVARTGVVAAVAIAVALAVVIWRKNNILALLSGLAVAAALRAVAF